MKAIPGLVLAVIFTLTLPASKVCRSQTVASGNITAEVVESVSAAFQAFTSFELETATPNKIILSGSSANVSRTFDLGAITINSGSDVTCNLVVKKASLSDSEGNGFIMEPSINVNSFESASQPIGFQTIRLDGKASLAQRQASGHYEGFYSIVVAYN
jgi:hypothetical protein